MAKLLFCRYGEAYAYAYAYAYGSAHAYAYGSAHAYFAPHSRISNVLLNSDDSSASPINALKQ